MYNIGMYETGTVRQTNLSIHIAPFVALDHFMFSWLYISLEQCKIMLQYIVYYVEFESAGVTV